MGNGALIEEFCRFCLEHPSVEIRNLFHFYMDNHPSDQLFLMDNFLLFIQAGEAARSAPLEVASLINTY